MVRSPYGTLLGMEVNRIERDLVRIRLPYRPEVVTVGDTVHGGAIASLIDVAATAAVWSGADLTTSSRGTTVAFTVSFLAPARGRDLVGVGRVIQRGRTISTCEVEVLGADGTSVARGLLTYKVG